MARAGVRLVGLGDGLVRARAVTPIGCCRRQASLQVGAFRRATRLHRGVEQVSPPFALLLWPRATLSFPL
jgi:hypothetical protein